jgi:hypothetical protein
MAHPSEARMFTRHVCCKRCLHGFLEQWLPRELFYRRVNLPHLHRVPGLFEHHRHRLEHQAYLGGSGTRFTRIRLGFTEQLVVEGTKPRELNLGSRV